MRILIIEDEVFIAMDLELQLIELGHEVTGIAASKRAAVDMAKTTEPDLALVDLHLAGPSSGAEAAAIIRSELNIPSVIISGSLHELTEGDLKEIKPIEILDKPYSSTKLAEVLKVFAASKNSSNNIRSYFSERR